MSPPTVFISYSHADEEWKDKLVSHLGVLEDLAVWNDRRIGAGDQWRPAIDAALNKAAVAVLLISADFLNSDFIRRHEVPVLLRRRSSDGVVVIPLLVRPCDWEGLDWLAASQMRPKDARPLSDGDENQIDTDLADLAKGIRRLLRSADEGRVDHELWTVPNRKPYVGREDLLKQLRERFIGDGKAACGQIQAIIGLGGIGKTQTAVEYAYRYRDHYEAVFFVRADTETEIQSGFGEVARKLKLYGAQEQEQVVAKVLDWLQKNAGWLLIFDNADRPELLKPVLPADHRGHVLLTSRTRVFRGLGIRRPIQVLTLPLNEAVGLLLERSQREEVALVSEERVACERLAEELGCLPLALEQAGAYLHEKQSQFQAFLAGFRKRGLTLLGKGTSEKHSEPVATTWSMNFREVEETSAAAADLLRASAFLNPEEIPLRILKQGGSELGPILAEALAEAREDGLVVDELLEPLTRYSLVSRNVAAQTYSVHRLVQEVQKREMAAKDRRVWAQRVIRALNGTFPEVEFSRWPVCEKLVPHVQVALSLVGEYALELKEAGRLFQQAGIYLWHRALYGEAEPLFLRSLEIYEKGRGKEHPDVATTRYDLGILYHAQGRFEKALPLFLRSLAIREKALGKDHPVLAQTLCKLANLYRDQGRFEKAEPIYRQSLAMTEKALGKGHPDVATTRYDLGLLYHAQGRFEKAGPLYRRSLKIREKELGKDHPDFAQTLGKLANLHRDQGRFKQAESLYRRSLEIAEKAFGENHPEPAMVRNDLGILHHAQGHIKQAEQLYRRSLEIKERALGKNHPDLVQTLGKLANLYRDQGRHGEAERLYRRSLEITEKALGREHPDAATARTDLGILHHAHGRFKKAERLYRRSLEITEKALGEDHPDLAQPLKYLGILCRDQERHEEAESLLLRSLEVSEKALGRDHPHYQEAMTEYAALLRATGREEEAVELEARSADKSDRGQ